MSWESTLEPLGRLVAVLLPLVLAAWGLSHWLKKRAQAPGSGQLRIVSALAVGSRERLVLVEVEGERVLIGVTPHAITALWQPHAFAQALAHRQNAAAVTASSSASKETGDGHPG